MDDVELTGGCQSGAIRYALSQNRRTSMSAIVECARRLWADHLRSSVPF